MDTTTKQFVPVVGELNNIMSYRDLLNKWLEHCKEQCKIHTQHEDFYGKMHLMLSVATILMSSSVGLASFVTEKSYALDIFFGCLALISSTFYTVLKFLRYEALEQKHKNLSVRYRSLMNDIEYNLCFDTDNKNPKEINDYVYQIKINMETLLKESPSGVN